MKGPNPILAGGAGVAAAVLVVGALNLNDARYEKDLEDACRSLPAAANLPEIVGRLGRLGYQPGCATESGDPRGGLPCTYADVGEPPPFPYLCEGADCSLYWRVGAVACLVEVAPDTLTLTRAEFMALGALADGI